MNKKQPAEEIAIKLRGKKSRPFVWGSGHSFVMSGICHYCNWMQLDENRRLLNGEMGASDEWPTRESHLISEWEKCLHEKSHVQVHCTCEYNAMANTLRRNMRSLMCCSYSSDTCGRWGAAHRCFRIIFAPFLLPSPNLP